MKELVIDDELNQVFLIWELNAKLCSDVANTAARHPLGDSIGLETFQTLISKATNLSLLFTPPFMHINMDKVKFFNV